MQQWQKRQGVGAMTQGVAPCRSLLILACGILTCLLSIEAGAQAAFPADQRPSSVVPTTEQLAPKPRIITDLRDLPPQPAPPRELEKPQGDLRLDVRGYQLSANAPPALVAALPTLLAAYTGERRSYEDLVNAAADVTRYLQREAGYYLGYAYLPEQAPNDGIVRIQVLEGRLDGEPQLIWPDTLPVRRDVIRAYLDRLKPGDILRVDELERVVFLINDLRGASAIFEIVQGSMPGTSSLRVTGVPESVWSSRADADVNGSRFLGQARASGLVSANSLLGRGDALTFNAMASVTGGLYFGLLGYTLPLGSDGVKLGTSLSAVRYKLDQVEFPLGINGDNVTLSTYALYPWVRSRNLNLFTVGTLDLKSNTDRQEAAGAALQRKIISVTLGLTGDLRDNLGGGAVSTFDGGVTFGNVRYADGAPAGLDDAPQFTKVMLGMNRLQNLIDGRLMFYFALRGQYAIANLDTNEQFRIGGPGGVRAFAPGEGTGDTGAVLNLELRLLPPEEWLGRLSHEMVFALFFDQGKLQYRHDPSRQNARFVNHASYSGAGLSLAWEQPGDFALRMSLAKQITGVSKSDTQSPDPRLYAQYTKFF